ncbi:MAG: hypothetical protein C4304_06265 [candidate division GAL15 bacterium]
MQFGGACGQSCREPDTHREGARRGDPALARQPRTAGARAGTAGPDATAAVGSRGTLGGRWLLRVRPAGASGPGSIR